MSKVSRTVCVNFFGGAQEQDVLVVDASHVALETPAAHEVIFQALRDAAEVAGVLGQMLQEMIERVRRRQQDVRHGEGCTRSHASRQHAETRCRAMACMRANTAADESAIAQDQLEGGMGKAQAQLHGRPNGVCCSCYNTATSVSAK